MSCSILLARLAEWHDPFATLRISKSADFMGVDPWVDFVPQTQRTRAYDLGRVRYWIELLLAEKRIPAVEIDNECNWGSYISPIPTLIDGNHRMIAHLVVGRERIMADYGGRTDVLSYLQGRRKSLPES